MIKAGKRHTGSLVLSCGFLAYLFLATFNPFLHSHSSCLLQQDYEYHTVHTESDADNHKPQENDSRCPTCEFLLKAYNATIPEITVLSLNNRHNNSSVFPAHQPPHQGNQISLYLQRAPPSSILS